MAKTISEIYKKYKTMPSLQMHMLRVAAVAYMICDSFEDVLPKEDIVIACLLHDMGNIIKSNLLRFPDFLEPKGSEYWQGVKDEYIKKYGEDEHSATIEIMKEVGVKPDVIFLADQDRFSLVCEHLNVNDMSVKICNYSDMRVDPHGVVSYDERMNEAKIRYKPKTLEKEKERQRLVACGKALEKQIFAKCKIKPEDITEETIQLIISSLKDFVIKTS